MWAWKVVLQRLADEFGWIVMVSHDPPGASKWNPIDPRMFSLIVHLPAAPASLL